MSWPMGVEIAHADGMFACSVRTVMLRQLKNPKPFDLLANILLASNNLFFSFLFEIFISTSSFILTNTKVKDTLII
jgi:hypothetical protein